MRTVILVDNALEITSYRLFPSVAATARAIGLDASTVHRALTGDRGCSTVTTEGLTLLDLTEADKDMVLELPVA